MARKNSDKSADQTSDTQHQEDLVKLLARKEAERAKNKKGEDSQDADGEAGWTVTDEELPDGLHFVDMSVHAKPLK